MKYLKKFVTKAQYDAFMETNANFPFVAYIVENNQLKYTSLYKFFNKLVGDGKAYIKTDYYMSNYDRITVKFDKVGVDQIILASKSTPFSTIMVPSQITKGYAAWQNDATLLIFSSGNVSLGMYESEGIYAAKIVSGNNTSVVNNYETAPTEVVSTFPLYVFAGNLKDSFDLDTRFYTGGISHITITDSRTGEVKLDLRPVVKRGENKKGMLDMVTGKFYGNANSEGAFMAF